MNHESAPDAKEAAAQSAAPSSLGDSQAPAAGEAPAPDAEHRRDFLAESAAVGIGAVVTITPLAAGFVTFLDPLRAKDYPAGRDTTAQFVPVTTLDALPDGGPPQQFAVKVDLVDAWTYLPSQPVGAVYMLRRGSEVKCFNAICPHAGCFVGYDAGRKMFLCPCHDSTFELDGTRDVHSPSRRDLDGLETEVDPATGEVRVRFENFLSGTEQKIPR